MGFKEPKSTTTEPGVITLAGDLAGTGTSATSPKVSGIQGNQVLQQSLGSGQDGYVLTWVNSATLWEAKPVVPSIARNFMLMGG